MKWKKWGKFFADKVLIWLVLAGVCVAGVWSMLDQHHWEPDGAIAVVAGLRLGMW